MGKKFNFGLFEKAEDRWEYTDTKYFKFNGKEIHVSDISNYFLEIGFFKWSLSYVRLTCKNGQVYKLPVKTKDLDEAINLRSIVSLDQMLERGKNQAKLNTGYDLKASEDRNRIVDALTTSPAYNPKPKEKDASVIGRAVIGGAIAGQAGAVVGALSAVDKNNKNRK